MGKLNVVLAVVLGLFMSGAALAQKTVKAPEIDPAEIAPDSVYYEKDWFKYYDQRLEDLEEPSLWQMSKDPNAEAFRFFWLPEEGAPIIIRIDISPRTETDASTATLTSKRSTGLAGESWGAAKDTETRVLSKEELKDLRFRFGYMKYWYVERTDEEDVINRPGPIWLFEGIHKGKYHAVERTNPAPGETRKLGLLLLSFIEVDESEVKWPQRPTMN